MGLGKGKKGIGSPQCWPSRLPEAVASEAPVLRGNSHPSLQWSYRVFKAKADVDSIMKHDSFLKSFILTA